MLLQCWWLSIFNLHPRFADNEDRDSASSREQAHHLSIVAENRQRKGKYTREDIQEEDADSLDDNRLDDGVPEQSKRRYSRGDNERIEEDLPLDDNQSDDGVTEQSKRRYSRDDNDRIDEDLSPDDNLSDDGVTEQSKRRYSRGDNDRIDEDLPPDDNQSHDGVRERASSVTSHTSLRSQLHSAQKDSSHVSSAPPLVHSFQSADWVEPQVTLTSDHRRDDVRGSDSASHPVKVSVGISTPSFNETGGTSNGQTADHSKLLHSLSNLGMDGRARLTGVHQTPRKVSSVRYVQQNNKYFDRTHVYFLLTKHANAAHQ